MGDIQCDIVHREHSCCIFARFVDTTNQKITSFMSLDSQSDPEIFKKVHHILFFRGTMPTFPSELSDFFPNLRFIELYDCGMKSVYAEDLKGFKELEKIKFDFNEISYLPSNLFKFTPKISQISFFRNKITKIGAEFFDNIPNLTKIDLRKNLKINKSYRKGRHDLNFLKRYIRVFCKPVESLQIMAKKVVRENMNAENSEEILMIAKHLQIRGIVRII